mmetsp:Transcript_32126/g.73595  ORF Transcript_32126/g.73595 Transcript_32126/m.73595 type:complete len:263 (+) Transcript_32126:635-1423(+)
MTWELHSYFVAEADAQNQAVARTRPFQREDPRLRPLALSVSLHPEPHICHRRLTNSLPLQAPGFPRRCCDGLRRGSLPRLLEACSVADAVELEFLPKALRHALHCAGDVTPGRPPQRLAELRGAPALRRQLHARTILALHRLHLQEGMHRHFERAEGPINPQHVRLAKELEAVLTWPIPQQVALDVRGSRVERLGGPEFVDWIGLQRHVDARREIDGLLAHTRHVPNALRRSAAQEGGARGGERAVEGEHFAHAQPRTDALE